MIVAGVLLAADSGARIGGPKALVLGTSGRPWVVDSMRTLTLGGCDEVYVTVGAEESAVREALDGEDVHIVDVGDWAKGVSSSLRRDWRRSSPGLPMRHSSTWSTCLTSVRTWSSVSWVPPVFPPWRGRRTTGCRAILC